MRTLEVRRHSHRKTGGGSQLSQAGVHFARRLGADMGPYDLVVTSVSPRARETAVAMGFAVDHELVTLTSDEAVYAELDAASPSGSIASMAAVFAKRGPTWLLANALAAMWRDLLTPLPEGGAALVITHSGDLELALIAALPDANHETWGDAFKPCEGAVVTFDGGFARFADVRFIRDLE